jgi:hypothetical protein
VAPADPALNRLLAAYLTQVVLHAMEGGGAGGLAALWNGWGEVLVRAGIEEGRIRLQARAWFKERGDGLVASFTGHPAAPPVQAAASPQGQQAAWLGTGISGNLT